MGEVVDFFPNIVRYCAMEIKRQRFGTYRYITVMALYEKLIDTPEQQAEDALSLHIPYKAALRKRLDNKENLSTGKMGTLLNFPSKLPLLEIMNEPGAPQNHIIEHPVQPRDY